MNTPRSLLQTAIRARTPVIAIQTAEEGRVLSSIEDLAAESVTSVQGDVIVPYRLVFRWSVTQGIVPQGRIPATHNPTFGMPDLKTWRELQGPADALLEFSEWAAGFDVTADDPHDPGRRMRAIDERASILIMCDIHRFLNPPEAGGRGDLPTMRALRDACATLRRTKAVAILLGPWFHSLGDADHDCFKMNWPLPTIAELCEMIEGAGAKVEDRVPVNLNGDTEVLARALTALTWNEAARTLSMAIVEAQELSVAACADLILSMKADILRKQRGLELIQPDETLADIAGLELLKEEMAGLPRLLTEDAKAKLVESPCGILLAGPPGTGKTLSAKVMGRAANVPVLMWSVSETHSKYVGESAQYARGVMDAADAINNCILVVDEVDTQLSEGGEGDSKAHEEVLGMVLNWMQEKQSDAIVVLTTNFPQRLRHALVERCDRQWFVDYPGLAACRQVVAIHCRKRGIMLPPEAVSRLGAIAHGKTLAGRNIEHAIRTAHSRAYLAGRTTEESDIAAALHAVKGLMQKRPQEVAAIRKWGADECEPASLPDEPAEASALDKPLAAADIEV